MDVSEDKNNEQDAPAPPLNSQHNEDWREKYQRLQAEFANYKKDEMRRFSEFSRYAQEEIVKKLLPLKDMVDRAALHVPQEMRDNAWAKGLAQITKAYDAFFGSMGVRPILTLGAFYDPKFHEVVEEISHEGAKPHEIVEEVESGYMWEDERVIRAAKVKVAKGDRNPV